MGAGARKGNVRRGSIPQKMILKSSSFSKLPQTSTSLVLKVILCDSADPIAAGSRYFPDLWLLPNETRHCAHYVSNCQWKILLERCILVFILLSRRC